MTVERYLNKVLNDWRPSGQLVGVLTDSLLTIWFLGFLGGPLPKTEQNNKIR